MNWGATMSEAPKPTGLGTPDVGGRLPGEILKAARVAQGLTLEQLGANLKVAPSKLSALEDGRLEVLPDASFARALAQAVCRTLKIDPAPVLAGLPAARISPLGQDKPPLNQPFKDAQLAARMFDGAGAGLLASLLRPQWLGPIVLLLAAAAIYLLPESFEWPSWRADAPVAPASAPEQTADGVLPLPVASDVGLAVPALPASGSSAAVPASAASDGSPVAESASSPLPLPAQPEAPDSLASRVGSAALSGDSQSLVSGDGPVFITVTEDAWIEVLDGEGNKRVSRIVRGGEAMSMGGVPPWRVRIGHAGGVQVSLRGQPVDLTPFTRNNVARLELK